MKRNAFCPAILVLLLTLQAYGQFTTQQAPATRGGLFNDRELSSRLSGLPFAPDTSSSSALPTGWTAADIIEVRISNVVFVPDKLTVRDGDTIRICNADGIWHKLFSYSEYNRFESSIESKGLKLLSGDCVNRIIHNPTAQPIRVLINNLIHSRGRLVLTVLPANNDSSDYPNLSGNWESKERPNSDWKPTSIEQKGKTLVFHNEHGTSSKGSFGEMKTRLIAIDWGGLGATITADRTTIQWDNGSVWRRTDVEKVGEFSVRPGQWFPTGIQLKSGETVRIEVTGQLNWPNTPPFGPDGHIISGGIQGYVANARIGSGKPAVIGSGGNVTAEADGELQLSIPRCNSCWDDHGVGQDAWVGAPVDTGYEGSFTFTVQKLR